MNTEIQKDKRTRALLRGEGGRENKETVIEGMKRDERSHGVLLLTYEKREGEPEIGWQTRRGENELSLSILDIHGRSSE
ncbi:Hypothetical protein FKW44_011405 [Caligus rogercresseyi]|uniref:Uncharacterized protein n=1 Tax=Caligus rogercresseyi TaxID=217165 RepID=A0A7T8HI28_CALRO|nr:Hypothetical protein FKW44_011405 [Caligus rogercresseyi]